MDFNGSDFADVTTARGWNKTYENNTPNGLLVVIGYHMPYNNPITTFRVNGLQVAAANSDGGHTRGTFTLMVPPWSTYEFHKNSGSSSIETWFEMRSQDSMEGFAIYDLVKERAWDVPYVNNSGFGIYVSISIINGTYEVGTLEVDGVVVGQSSSSPNHKNNHTIMTLVPEGATYMLRKPLGTISFNAWSEVRKVA